MEALARGPAGSVLELPEALFATARQAGLLTELDQLDASRALEVARAASWIAGGDRSAQLSMALCLRRTAGAGRQVDFVLTQDRDLLNCIVRMVMLRFGDGAPR